MARESTRNLVLAAFFVALGLLMPFFTAQVPALGARFCPCIFLSFWVGSSWEAPGSGGGADHSLLRSFCLACRPCFPPRWPWPLNWLPTACSRGALPEDPSSFPGAHLGHARGRLVWGVVSLVLYGLTGSAFGWQVFTASAFINPLPGIIFQIVFIPVVVMALRRAGLLKTISGALTASAP